MRLESKPTLITDLVFALANPPESRLVSCWFHVHSSFLIGILLLAALLANGCSASSDVRNENAEPSSTIISDTSTVSEDDVREKLASEDVAPDESQTEAAVEPVSPSLVYSRNNTLFVPAPIGCDAADPAYDHPFDIRAANAFTIVPEIHVGLFSLSSDGSKLNPELAESYSVNEDFSSYEFSLRDGLKFSDGSTLTTADVKWSWERALSMATGDGRANDVFGSIVGATTLTATQGEISGIEAVDDSTLKVHLSVPRPEFTTLLADPVASVLKVDNVWRWPTTWNNATGMNFSDVPFDPSSMPVGAGPFKLIEYATHLPIANCVMTRNDHYWAGPPALERIVAVTDGFGDSFVDEQEAFEIGLIDFFLEGFHDGSDSRSVKPNGLGKSLIVADAPRTWFLILNPAQPPFDDLSFRRAVVAGSDVAELFPHVPTDDRRLVPPSVANGDAEVDGIQLDMNGAIAAFEQSEYSDEGYMGVEFESGGFIRSVLPPLFDQWREMFDFDVRMVKPDSGVASGYEPMRLFFFSPQYPDPYPVLRTFIEPFGEGNQTVEFAIIEEMIMDAVLESDVSIRSRKFAEVEQYILEKSLALPIRIDEYHFEFRVQSRVNGLVFPQFGGSAFRDVWIEEASTDSNSR